MTWIDQLSDQELGIRIEDRSAVPIFYSCQVLIDRSETNEPLYVAACLELDGAMAQGMTESEAIHNLYHDVIPDYIASLREDGLPVPPKGCFRETWTR